MLINLQDDCDERKIPDVGCGLSGVGDINMGLGVSGASHCSCDVPPNNPTKSHLVRDKDSVLKVNSFVEVRCILHMWIDASD